MINTRAGCIESIERKINSVFGEDVILWENGVNNTWLDSTWAPFNLGVWMMIAIFGLETIGSLFVVYLHDIDFMNGWLCFGFLFAYIVEAALVMVLYGPK